MQLDQLIAGLEVGVSAFALCEVRQGVSFVLQEVDKTAVHYVLSGEGSAWNMTGQATPLSPHTIMIIPPGTCVTIACEKGRQLNLRQPDCAPLPDGWDQLTVGGGAPGVALACGHVQATYMQTRGMFDHLREPLAENIADDTSTREAFHTLLHEMAAPKPGTKVLAETLMKQCLIALLRRQAAVSGECHAPWLAALGSPGLERAVSAMLDRPEAGHSVESLGEVAGMSRAAFAEQFKTAFGHTPIGFLTHVRMRRAAQLLTATDLPVKMVAARVGYDSRSYFSRSFKAFAGIDPAGFRANPSTFELHATYIGDEAQ